MCLLFTALSASLLVWSFSSAQAAPPRPPITEISHISVYASNSAQTEHFFAFDLGLAKAADPENPAGQRYYVNETQFVEVLPLPAGKSPSSLDHVAFATTNARALRAFLAANAEAPGKIETGKDGSRWFRVKDPEGNVIEFVQNPPHPPALPAFNPIGHHMIHVGFVVYSRESEDKFYRTLLGFKPYWFGGNKANVINWISQQVPDGRDWLEYMMMTTKPNDRTLGVMDHFSIGVVDMAATAATLKNGNRLNGSRGVAEIGRDGKWQLDIYDPDGTRVEFMEFNNVQPPCCSPFTAPNPTP